MHSYVQRIARVLQGLFSLWHLLIHWKIRYLAAWILAFGIAGLALYHSWKVFHNDRRTDRDDGHSFIDFGGQYLMGRMLVKGHGWELYNRNYQRVLLQEAYPIADEIPKADRNTDEMNQHDAEELMGSLMGRGKDEPDRISYMVTPLAARTPWDLLSVAAWGNAKQESTQDKPWNRNHLEKAVANVGGPLYPPINAFVYYPLALFTPLWGYHANQIFGVLLAFVAGLAFSKISAGRVWWPVAAVGIILFPGFIGNLNLAQNATLTLAVVAWGWAFIAKDKPIVGGMIWGLLAFKPVWAMAYFLVPLLTRRWRVCLAMILTGGCLAALTLPVVGIHSWVNWLKVGKEATALYQIDKNWIQLSRDILSIPRKWFNFDSMNDDQRRDNLQALLVGWGILIGGLEITLRLAFFRRERIRQITGPGPALLFLAAWMSCFHFMYYDVLLGALPAFLLFAEPQRFLQPSWLVILPVSLPQLGLRVRDYYRPRPVRDYPPSLPFFKAGYRNLWVINRMEPLLLLSLCLVPCLFDLREPPYDTYLLIGLWVWCGWLVGHKPDIRAGSKKTGLTASFGEIGSGPGFTPQFVEFPANVRSTH